MREVFLINVYFHRFLGRDSINCHWQKESLCDKNTEIFRNLRLGRGREGGRVLLKEEECEEEEQEEENLRTLRNRSISMSLPVMAPLHTGHTGAATPPHLGCMVVSMSLDRSRRGLGLRLVLLMALFNPPF